MGDVHHGITQMNTDPSERKHEIAVNSTATTISWNEPSLCLIDTPGHIDFNRCEAPTARARRCRRRL
ncbi:MAG: GTP-binding protein [Verrucomicrobiales bacterium]